MLGASCAPGICGELRCCGGQDLLVVDSSELRRRSDEIYTHLVVRACAKCEML